MAWLRNKPLTLHTEYTHQQNTSSFVQITIFRLFGVKPLSEPKMTCSQLDTKEQTSVQFESNYNNFIQEN